MAEASLIRPDTTFLRNVLAGGGSDLKKCMQCGACSVACRLSTEEAPFPRRQMITAGWGLKEKVVADPALWLCHNCGDCDRQCPRGVRPAATMAALRQQAILHFAWPGCMGKLVNDWRALPLLLLIPALMVAALALWAPKPPESPHLEFAQVFPIPALDALFIGAFTLVVLIFVMQTRRFVQAAGGSGGGVAWAALREIGTHKRFRDCSTSGWAHLMIFWTFLGLAAVSATIGAGMQLGVLRTPLPATNAIKIFANLCSVFITVGIVMRLGSLRRAAYFDRFFLLTLAGVVATGIASQLLRLAEAATLMYVVYFTHLVLALALFLYAPYSKFAHLAYRTAAIVMQKQRSRSTPAGLE